ncbi:MAG: Rpn family recombination-promoting nuclease/putative transposase [Firmicutes bacterium]|nr:Rpn family recombination-promoting nuclease/putative transposase [Bacillota bacterium]
MSEFLMKPKIDFVFKELMAIENVRIGFLSAILKLNPDDIKETHILNTDLRKTHADDKLGILDVRVIMNNDIEIDIEIQLSELRVWADRSLFYLAKMYTEQISEGQDYTVFKKCVSISILDFKLFHDTEDFYSCFHICEDTRHKIYTDKFEFHVLELPKLPQELKEDNNDILLWAKFINAEKKEEFDMLSKKNLYINNAYEQLQIISQDERKRFEYESREKAVRDHNQSMLEATERGIEIGRQRGIEIGRQRGIEIGEEKKSIDIAKQLIKLGISNDIISKSTGLSESQIETLKINHD